jgi:hypothetical protein
MVISRYNLTDHDPYQFESFNFINYFSQGVQGHIDEVNGRICAELARLEGVEDILSAMTGYNMWRTKLILGMAHNLHSLREGHLNVAVAIELVNIAYFIHKAGTSGGAGGTIKGLRDWTMGRSILAGDYYLTRAALAALESDRLRTLGAIAAIMQNIPIGHICSLSSNDTPSAAQRRYRQVWSYTVNRVTLNCIVACLSEAGHSNFAIGDLERFARLIAFNHATHKDVRWWRSAADGERIEWNMPIFFSYRAAGPDDRAQIMRFVSNEDEHSPSKSCALSLIERTGGIDRCEHEAKEGFLNAANWLSNFRATTFQLGSLSKRCPTKEDI